MRCRDASVTSESTQPGSRHGAMSLATAARPKSIMGRGFGYANRNGGGDDDPVVAAFSLVDVGEYCSRATTRVGAGAIETVELTSPEEGNITAAAAVKLRVSRCRRCSSSDVRLAVAATPCSMTVVMGRDINPLMWTKGESREPTTVPAPPLDDVVSRTAPVRSLRMSINNLRCPPSDRVASSL